MSDDFTGFEWPKANWSRLPHRLIELLPEFSTKAELAVVLYILRHTWGFQEFEKAERLTLDEFENGRVFSQAGRIDEGVGMSRNAIREDLRRAEEHGFIEVEVDDDDPARVRKAYRLRMAAPLTSSENPQSGWGAESAPPALKS